MKSYLLFIILVFPLHLKGQYMLEGKIMNNAQQPLEFVNVVLYSTLDTVFVTGTTTLKDGSYKLSVTSNGTYLLEASFIGYQKKQKIIEINVAENYEETIILEEESQLLKEVTVTAVLPQFRITEGILVADVNKTILSKEHSINDILTKIPGIINNKGTIEIFGNGQPVYYINNRKIKNNEEVNHLNVKNIQKIELITNPGAKFDANVNSVIKIYTFKKENGWSIQVGTLAKQSKKFSHRENITIGYKKDKLNASIYYNFYDYKNKSYQYLVKEIHIDTLWRYTTTRDQFPIAKIHNYRLNMDYEITPKHIVGGQLSGSKSNNKYITFEKNKIEMDKEDYLFFDSPNNTKNTIDNIQFNLFHNASWNNKLSSSFNIDYVHYRERQNQHIQEITSKETVATDSRLHSNYNIFASEFILNYILNENNSLSLGVEYSQIRGNGGLNIKSEILKDAKYTSSENKYAGFMEHNFKKNKFSLNTGLRYENVYRNYSDLVDSKNNLSNYDYNFYPSASISYAKNEISNTLSFSVKTLRPSLSYLNGRTYYQNRFLYQKGNPNLIPQTSYILEWVFGYKFLNLRTSYTRINDFISATYIENPENKTVIISTWQNFDKADFFKTNLNLQHSFKFWNPSLSIGIIKPFFSSVYLGKTVHYNKLNFYFTFNNYLKLPKDFLFNVDYYYDYGGSNRIFIFRPVQSLDISAQKSFMKDKLSIKLTANDIFRKLDYYETAKINKFTFFQNENYSSWGFSLSLIFRFNQQNIKYRGKSAAKSEINRL